jgi:polyferredoxin
MTEYPAARALLTCPPTYMQRSGAVACTTCGAAIGATDADQIRHTTWHSTLAELIALASGR